eukprot:TRINITY_DN8177_c0_g1_i1.p1 TRINITY_DN8177_c0_g1~~TRINITY_DN8177_c0_g1_i1.p1  ORF type:complete len:360 (-),score=39.64 TRINITY_DN8177_c0_g1_i1:26-1105(-)
MLLDRSLRFNSLFTNLGLTAFLLITNVLPIVEIVSAGIEDRCFDESDSLRAVVCCMPNSIHPCFDSAYTRVRCCGTATDGLLNIPNVAPASLILGVLGRSLASHIDFYNLFVGSNLRRDVLYAHLFRGLSDFGFTDPGAVNSKTRSSNSEGNSNGNDDNHNSRNNNNNHDKKNNNTSRRLPPFKRQGFRYLAEIGVQQGIFASRLLERMNGLLMRPKKYFMVDRWQEERSVTYIQEAIQAVSRFWDVTSILQLDSAASADIFADNFMDFAYIDAGHDYCSALADIKAWWPKVRPGGILAGDDYGSFREEYLFCPNGTKIPGEVVRAVDEFFGMKSTLRSDVADMLFIGNQFVVLKKLTL